MEKGKENPAIIYNYEPFGEKFIPEKILFRENEIEKITSYLSPWLKSHNPGHLLIYGPPGTGKTCIVLSVLGKLSSKLPASHSYVNCYKSQSLHKILEEVTCLKDYNSFIYNTEAKLEKLKSFCKKKPLIIVLDEIDKLSPKEANQTIINLAEIENISLICIALDKDFFLKLEERARSRFNPLFMYFPPYSQEQLIEILQNRALRGLIPSTWDRKTLKEIAKLSHNDARMAIQNLKKAAFYAEASLSESINSSHIRKALVDIKKMEVEKTIKEFNEHLRLLYQLVKDNPGILSSQLKRKYYGMCKVRKIEPMAERTYSEYLNKLRRLGLIKSTRALVRGNIWRYEAR